MPAWVSQEANTAAFYNWTHTLILNTQPFSISCVTLRFRNPHESISNPLSLFDEMRRKSCWFTVCPSETDFPGFGRNPARCLWTDFIYFRATELRNEAFDIQSTQALQASGGSRTRRPLETPPLAESGDKARPKEVPGPDSGPIILGKAVEAVRTEL